MNKLQLTFLFFLCQLVSTNITINTRCACSEYSIDICASYFYCSWDGYTCVDLDCTLESQQNCYPEYTMFQCQWDYGNNQCITYPYTCIEITNQDYCENNSYHELDCMWNDSNGCQRFSCKNAELCDSSKCSYWQGTCGEPISSINCGSLQSELCYASDGKGQYCALNDNLLCSSYDAIVNCPQLSDNIIQCLKYTGYCVYENKQCRKITCEDYLVEDDCEFVYDPQSEEITPCFWTSSRCRTASNLDIENLSQLQCRINTYYNYKWEDSKCQSCQQYSFDIKLGLIFLLQLII